MTLQDETAQADNTTPDRDRILQDWFLDIVDRQGDRSVARTLSVSGSKLWKLKNGQRRLQAAELVLLHQTYGAPLPRLVPEPLPANAADEALAAEPAETAASADDKALFDFAYSRVARMEAAKPLERQANAFERLDRVFHILETVRQTPDAVLKDIE